MVGFWCFLVKDQKGQGLWLWKCGANLVAENQGFRGHRHSCLGSSKITIGLTTVRCEELSWRRLQFQKLWIKRLPKIALGLNLAMNIWNNSDAEYIRYLILEQWSIGNVSAVMEACSLVFSTANETGKLVEARVVNALTSERLQPYTAVLGWSSAFRAQKMIWFPFYNLE